MPAPRLFIGTTDTGFSSTGGDVVVVDDTREKVEKELLREFNAQRRAYESETFRTFAEMSEWNGARVEPLKLGKPVTF